MYLDDEFCEFRARSFYIEREKICDVLVLFFKLHLQGWVSLSIGEGVAIFSHGLREAEYQIVESLDDEFAYPVSVVNSLRKYLDKKISGIYEYRIEGVKEGCLGIYFDCGDCGLSVLEYDGCLTFTDGMCDFGDKVSLVKRAA